MGKETMKAVVVERPGKIAIKQIPIPEPTDYQALVKMEVVAICNSTDSKLKDGHFPEFDTYPCRLGHESIGTVVKVGKKVKSFKVGDRVINASYEFSFEGLASCFGAFAEYAIAGDHIAMTEDNVADEAHYYDPVFETQKVVPPDIPSKQAILLSIWREVYSSFGDFHIEPHTGSMLIIGGGPVGQSFVTIAKNMWKLNPVILATRSKWKRDVSLVLGADGVIDASKDTVSLAKKIQENGFDYIVDAVGSPTIINDAISLIKFGGTICGYGTIPEKEIVLEKGRGPYNWELVMHQWPTYSAEAAAHEPLCEHIRQGTITSEPFITQELPFDKIQGGFDLIQKQNIALKVILHLKD